MRHLQTERANAGYGQGVGGWAGMTVEDKPRGGRTGQKDTQQRPALPPQPQRRWRNRLQRHLTPLSHQSHSLCPDAKGHQRGQAEPDTQKNHIPTKEVFQELRP